MTFKLLTHIGRVSGAPALAIVAAISSSSETLAMAGSGEAWGARDPAACEDIVISGQPSPGDVAKMLRCKYEGEVYGELTLLENIKVVVEPGVPFMEMYNSYAMENADVRATVYPISGGFMRFVCKTRSDAAIYSGNADLNCQEQTVPSAKGICWPTQSGAWKCLMTGAKTETRDGQRPPQ